MAHPSDAGTVFLSATFLLCAACAEPEPDPQPPSEADWRAVVEVERAFAQAARESGTRGAFLRFIDQEGVLFRPGPVPGVAALEAATDAAPDDDPPGASASGDGAPLEGGLRWTPEVAAVSEDGALGFTSGPYRALDPGGSVTGTGRYATVWARGESGEYRFVVDVGVPGPVPEPFPDTLAVRRARVMTTRPVLAGRTLIQADSALQATYRTPDAGSLGGLAFPAGLRVLRRGGEPGRGPAAFLAAALEVAERGGLSWVVSGSGTSPDGTLGYVYGMAEALAGPEGAGAPFLRIWARGSDGAWQLLLDLLDLPDE